MFLREINKNRFKSIKSRFINQESDKLESQKFQQNSRMIKSINTSFEMSTNLSTFKIHLSPNSRKVVSAVVPIHKNKVLTVKF